MAKSIADKADVGAIMSAVAKEDLVVLDKVIKAKGCRPPTMVTDIYKLRRGRYKGVRIWSYVDLGTARVEDLFATDQYYNPIGIDIVKAMFTENLFKFESETESLDTETGEIVPIRNEPGKGKFSSLL